VHATGYRLRLGRLFEADSGRSFITAIDHGVTQGVAPGGEHPVSTIEQIIKGKPDGVLLSAGMLERTASLFAHRGAPAVLVRCDWILFHPTVNDLGEQHRIVLQPEQALALGADAIVMFLMIGTHDGGLLADNAAQVADIAQRAHAIGLPLIVEVVLWGTKHTDQRDASRLAWGSRVAVELGADAIKTEWTGAIATMRTITETAAAPVLVLGGSKSPDPEALLQATRDALAAGSSGVIYGRNVWQHPDPVAISTQLRSIIHDRGPGR
jgi:DhnA family fructose-bisphosphate aldolase class Ia